MSQRHSAEAVEKPLQLALDLEVCRFIWREAALAARSCADCNWYSTQVISILGFS
ncbi:hypothetical protein PGT21_016130 [Puccinia graminis f. sp. tritici]|uniref:Uncharacterized protein n=1 Tax=Puccinia graminis f. sp. tritici TaxID=56615 RepID=A0A5B0QW95_PUCGR|nr:hypothetical protein PGT21_016130 [Puccinia graminis f. sp. tritici]